MTSHQASSGRLMEEDEATSKEGRITPYVITSCIMAASASLMFGYSIGVSGGITSMDDFLIKFFPTVYTKKQHCTERNYCKFNDQGLQAFTSSLYIAGLLATFAASQTTKELGRRPTMIMAGFFYILGVGLTAGAKNLVMLILGCIVLGCGVGFGNQVVIGVLLGTGLKDTGGLSHSSAIITMIMICLFVAGFAWSWGPMGWLIPSEIFPLESRSAGQSIVVCINLFFTFVIAQAFLSMLCFFKYGIFFFFAAWVLVMSTFVLWFLPETKNTPIDAMAQVWRSHWFWKMVVGTEDEDEKVEGDYEAPLLHEA